MRPLQARRVLRVSYLYQRTGTAAIYMKMGRLRVSATALLVLFSAAARAGIVAADLGAGAYRFGRFGLGCSSLVLDISLLLFLFALEFFGFLFGARGLD